MFTDPPAETDWIAQLGAQTRIAVSTTDALAAVRAAWEAAATE